MVTASLALRGYAICTAGRSGSNWLCELLASTNALGYPLEYFCGEGRRRMTDPAYPDDAAEQLAWILRIGATPNGVYGVKAFPSHIDRIAPHVRWTQALPNLRFVHLTRRDLVGQAMSLHRANRTDQWRSTWPARAVAEYDGAEIRRCLNVVVRDQARWAAFFARTGIEPLHLVYEDVVDDPQAAVDAVADLMQVTPSPRFDDKAIDLNVQRDAVTDVWRARFVEERGDPSFVDAL